MTSLGAGFNISNLRLVQRGGNNISVNPPPLRPGSWNFLKNVLINYKFLYRHVFHNSMLEGYGIVKHDVDEHKDSPVDRYVLPCGVINRNLVFHEFSLGAAMRYANIQFRLFFYPEEYDLPVNYKQYPYPADLPFKGNHNRSENNHLGSVAVFFKM